MSANIQELFQSGHLNAAVAAAAAAVKSAPTDIRLRSVLAELLCFQGEFERADKQLDLILHQDTQAAVGVALLRQLIRAEMTRREVFNGAAAPELLSGDTESIKPYLAAVVAAREGDLSQAAEQLAAAESERDSRSGHLNDKVFDDIRDIDDLTAGVLEVLTSTGKYFWVPLHLIVEAQFHPPENMIDLLWRRVTLQVRDGPEGEVYVPAIYPATDPDDEQALLGRSTDWVGENDEPVRGSGQRMFLAGDEAIAVMSLESLAVGSC